MAKSPKRAAAERARRVAAAERHRNGKPSRYAEKRAATYGVEPKPPPPTNPQ